MHDELTNAEVAAKLDMIDLFREALRAAIDETIIDPTSDCAREAREGLRRIAETLDQVSVVTLHNLAVLDVALGGLIMQIIELRLMSVGGGPTLDCADATAFFDEFSAPIDATRRNKMH